MSWHDRIRRFAWPLALIRGASLRRTRSKNAKIVCEWRRSGKPAPPPHHVKIRNVRRLARRFGCVVFVETGTCQGDMIEGVRDLFEAVYSIELSELFFHAAVRRFRKCANIRILQGDSADLLPHIIDRINRPTLFWLDAHYSGGITARGPRDTPVCEELDACLRAKHPGHVILIDDARCFGVDPAYPTIESLTELVTKRKPNLDVDVRDDCVQITPSVP